MYQTILIPLDGSLLAERALPYATDLARGAHARLVLVEAVGAATASSNAVVRMQAAAVGEVKAYLSTLADRLAKEDVVADIATPIDGPADGILGEVERRRADLVVMTTHGRSGIGRWVYGSVADEVMRHAAVPILLVPAACEEEWPTGRLPRVLVTLDGSPFAEAALSPAGDLAAALDGELVLLEVVEPINVGVVAAYPASFPELDVEAQLTAAQAYVEATATKLRASGRNVTVRTEFGAAVPTIIEVARQEAVEAIALASHGSGGITRLVMGSVATGTIQRATVPILIVRPAEVLARAAEEDQQFGRQ